MRRSGRGAEADRAGGGPSWNGLEGLEPRWLLAAWYVNSVADPLENGSALHPYNSIQEAIDAAAPGDTVNVRPGTYAEDLWIDKANLTLVSTKGASRTFVNGTSTGFADFGMGGNFIIGGTGVTISGFTFRSGVIAAGKVGTAVYLKGGVGATASNLNFRDNVIECRAATVADGFYDVNGIETDYGNFSGVSIYNNRFTGTPDDGYNGIYVNGAIDGANVSAANHLEILNNTFVGKVQRAIGVETSNTDIAGNSIVTSALVANAWTGIQVQNWQAIGSDDVSNVTIENNTIKGFTSGVKLGMNAESKNELLTNITVSGNFFNGGTGGILVRSSAEGVQVRNNSFAAALTGLAAENTDPDAATLDASGNWWGSAAAATVAAQAGADVDYTPWLASGTDTARATGFQGCFVTLYVDDDSPQAGAAGRIQEAVDLVTGSTVYVLAGTYAEDLWLDHRGLRLIGAGRAATTVVGQTTDFADFGNGGNVVVGAANVTITGFKFQSGVIAPDKVGTILYLKGGLGATAMNLRFYNNELEHRTATVPDGAYDINGIETDYGNFSGVWIYNNRFTGAPDDGYNGIYVNGAVDGGNVSAGNRLRIFNNTFLGNVQRAIAVETSNTEVAGNTLTTRLAFADAWAGIQVQNWQAQGSDDVRNVTISRNVITGFNWAMKLGMNDSSEPGRRQLLANVTVLCNIVAGNNQGILVRSWASGVRLLFNRLMGSAGLAVENADPDQHVLTARFNWWGDETGPTHASNPGGQGEAVSDFVLFTPWLAA